LIISFLVGNHQNHPVYIAQEILALHPTVHSPKKLWGYNVYYGIFNRDYDFSLDVGNWTSSTIASHEPGMTYYFAVTVYNTEGSESGYSNEVSIKIGTTVLLRPMPWVPLLLLND
jgi:hypothetical protein